MKTIQKKIIYIPSYMVEQLANPEFITFIQQHKTLERRSKRGKIYKVAELAGHNLGFDVEFLRKWYGTKWCPATAWAHAVWRMGCLPGRLCRGTPQTVLAAPE